jgi:hypothetical protein
LEIKSSCAAFIVVVELLDRYAVIVVELLDRYAVIVVELLDR